MKTRIHRLKVKIKTLAAEARIIRHAERQALDRRPAPPAAVPYATGPDEPPVLAGAADPAPGGVPLSCLTQDQRDRLLAAFAAAKAVYDEMSSPRPPAASAAGCTRWRRTGSPNGRCSARPSSGWRRWPCGWSKGSPGSTPPVSLEFLAVEVRLMERAAAVLPAPQRP